MKNKLLPCPFCGGKATIIVCDDKGNIQGNDYLKEPYSGISYAIGHYFSQNEECPISHFENITLGTLLYETKQEAIKTWNKRVNNG